jgi:hypothetical protein
VIEFDRKGIIPVLSQFDPVKAKSYFPKVHDKIARLIQETITAAVFQLGSFSVFGSVPIDCERRLLGGGRRVKGQQ